MARPTRRRSPARLWIASLAIALTAGLVLDAPAWAQAEPVEALAEDVPTEEPPSALAQFTTAVENREPVDAVSFLSNDQTRITFFTDLRNLRGQVVFHRWQYGGDVVADVRFEVGGDRWRVWSNKTLMPEWLGDWRVSVVMESGEVLATEAFTYQMRP